ncbi:MAG: NAD(P)/FAD-dependent oxidoreductase, partial [Lapillicoccus sp.]
SSAEVTAPGFVNDLFSAFYPLAAASPVIRDLHLEHHGLEWCRAPSVLTHVLPDDRSVTLCHDPADTAASVEALGAGDGDAWLRMFAQWQQIRDPLLDALFTPFPPLGAAARMARVLRTAGLLDFVRLALTPVRRLGQEQFSGEGAPLLLTGNAMHSDLTPDGAGSGLFGWLLAMLGQDVGFPVPRGGAGQLAAALLRRAESLGVEVVTSARVTSIRVSNGAATGVVLNDGTLVRARRAVLADVSAPSLYRDLLPDGATPDKILRDLGHFQWDSATLKLNWALSRPIPWTSAGAAGSGTVHLGVDSDGFVDVAADLSVGRIPRHPFVLLGQMTTADPTRSPAGTESAWAYTHLPQGIPLTADIIAEHADRVESLVESAAPGFGSAMVGRHVQSPADLASADANLVDGAINGGTSGLHQQLVFRPTPGLGRPETPIGRLYLASAAAHPGGGVHGACGWNAARAALSADGRSGAVHRALVSTAWGRLLR